MSEGLMNGWISVHRKVFSNPILKPKSNHKWSILEVWLWLCAKTCYKREKVVLGNDIFWIEAGQMITSQEKLRERFNWSKTKLRNKLKLMEKDEMIKVQASKKMTMITLLNYEPYQNRETKEKPQKNHKKTHSNKGNKEIKNSYNSLFNKPLTGQDRLDWLNSNVKFSEWYDLYDKKVGKKKVSQAWKRIVKPKLCKDEDNTFYNQLLLHTEKYVKETPDKQFRLDPERYIKYEKWEDEIVESKKVNKYKIQDYPHDKTGFQMAWCEACGKKGTYYKEQIKEGSKCCNKADLVPFDPKDKND